MSSCLLFQCLFPPLDRNRDGGKPRGVGDLGGADLHSIYLSLCFLALISARVAGGVNRGKCFVHRKARFMGKERKRRESL